MQSEPMPTPSREAAAREQLMPLLMKAAEIAQKAGVNLACFMEATPGSIDEIVRNGAAVVPMQRQHEEDAVGDRQIHAGRRVKFPDICGKRIIQEQGTNTQSERAQ